MHRFAARPLLSGSSYLEEVHGVHSGAAQLRCETGAPVTQWIFVPRRGTWSAQRSCAPLCGARRVTGAPVSQSACVNKLLVVIYLIILRTEELLLNYKI